MGRAFFLNTGQKLLDPDWLRRFILSIRKNIKSMHNKDSLTNKVVYIKYIQYIRLLQCFDWPSSDL